MCINVYNESIHDFRSLIYSSELKKKNETDLQSIFILHFLYFIYLNTVANREAKLVTIPTKENQSDVEEPMIEFLAFTLLGST